jgi:hypothetical protein
MKKSETIINTTIISGELILLAVAGYLDAGEPNKVQSQSPESIRPFNAEIPDAKIKNLFQLIAATRWTEMETGPHQSQG